jgi:hypothetical protein
LFVLPARPIDARTGATAKYRIGPTGHSSLLHRIPCVTVRLSCSRSIKEASSSSLFARSPRTLSLSLSVVFFAKSSHWQVMYAGQRRAPVRKMFCNEANQSNPNQWRTGLGRVKQAIEWCHDPRLPVVTVCPSPTLTRLNCGCWRTHELASTTHVASHHSVPAGQLVNSACVRACCTLLVYMHPWADT